MKLALKDGVKIGEVLHTEATILEPIMADHILAARQQSEVVRFAPNGEAVMVKSDTLFTKAIFDAVVVSIGNVPYNEALLPSITHTDLLLIENAVETYMKATVAAAVKEAKRAAGESKR